MASTRANLSTMTDEKQPPAEDQDDEKTETTRAGLKVRTPSRDEFFGNLEKVSEPDSTTDSPK
ncbi:MAG: hypothetical protein QOE36_3785 [Gaiellaceae bacterium]|jgi:hypothetical protein|nr:hypothetical protein [Gaiellaceae bacterium]